MNIDSSPSQHIIDVDGTVILEVSYNNMYAIK